MPFENNAALQKCHIINAPPEIDKYDTHKKWWLKKMAHICENAQRLFAKD